MNQSDLSEIFHRKGWLATQPETFREAWLQAGMLRPVLRGERLYSQGDPPGGVYGIAEGFADVMVASGYAAPMLGHIARPGWWGGKASVMTGSLRRAEIRARTDL